MMNMKWFFRCVISAIVAVEFAASTVGNAQNILEVPKTSEKPVIDGQLDGVWLNVPGTRMLKTCFNASSGWEDLSGTFRILWDTDNLYFYVQAIDERIRWDGLNSYDDDGIEIFLDADNSKGSSFDRVNDIQLRINREWIPNFHIETGFGSPRIEWPFSSSGMVYWFSDTEYGYDMEAKIPLKNIKLQVQAPHYFGLEMQINDNDTGIRDDVLKWWSESNDSWMTPSRFGTACLLEEVVNDTLQIPYTDTVPQIDGIPEASWDDARFITLNHYTRIISAPKNWKDCAGSAQLMWDDQYLYFFCSAIDQNRINDGGDAWQNDGFEFYVDGNYSHGTNYDQQDDTQYIFRWNSNTVVVAQGPLPPSDFQFAQTNTSEGWQAEIAMPLSGINVAAFNNTIFGMELTYNDDDNGGDRDHQMHYWNSQDATWMHPNAFATARLVGGNPPVIAYGDVDLNGQVQAYDASVILKSLVGLLQLNAMQKLNAEVSLDGTVSALDASLILQYRVGSINTLPHAGLYKKQELSSTVLFGEPVYLGKEAEIPLVIPGKMDLCALEGEIQFDAGVLTFESMNWNASLKSVLSEARCSEGKVQFVFALNGSIGIDQELGSIRFGFNPECESTRTNLCLSRIRVNENPVQENSSSVEIAGLGTEVISGNPPDFRLYPNFPNPFNPVTVLSYDIPKPCDVELSIYNMTGQKVEVLVHEYRQPGHYQTIWKAGRMETGLYFYRLQAGERLLIGKMMLVK